MTKIVISLSPFTGNLIWTNWRSIVRGKLSPSPRWYRICPPQKECKGIKFPTCSRNPNYIRPQTIRLNQQVPPGSQSEWEQGRSGSHFYRERDFIFIFLSSGTGTPNDFFFCGSGMRWQIKSTPLTPSHVHSDMFLKKGFGEHMVKIKCYISALRFS